MEILDVFKNTIHKVFPDTEVLSLRNICGEGLSLTHDEYAFFAKQLEYFPEPLSAFLLDGNVNTPDIVEEVLLQDFIAWLLLTHPLSGQLRLCNKLVSLLQQSSPQAHHQIKTTATILQQRIEKTYGDVYLKHFHAVENIDVLIERAMKCQTGQQYVNQVEITGLPRYLSLSHPLAHSLTHSH